MTPLIPQSLSLDATKAFDCVEWAYLIKTLERLSFGDHFITWIKTLYNTPYACVLTNGLISNQFQVQRSTRQGCPLSPVCACLGTLLFFCSPENQDAFQNIGEFPSYAEPHVHVTSKNTHYFT